MHRSDDMVCALLFLAAAWFADMASGEPHCESKTYRQDATIVFDCAGSGGSVQLNDVKIKVPSHAVHHVVAIPKGTVHFEASLFPARSGDLLLHDPATEKNIPKGTEYKGMTITYHGGNHDVESLKISGETTTELYLQIKDHTEFETTYIVGYFYGRYKSDSDLDFCKPGAQPRGCKLIEQRDAFANTLETTTTAGTTVNTDATQAADVTETTDAKAAQAVGEVPAATSVPATPSSTQPPFFIGMRTARGSSNITLGDGFESALGSVEGAFGSAKDTIAGVFGGARDAAESAVAKGKDALGSAKAATKDSVGQGHGIVSNAKDALRGALGGLSHALLHVGEDCWYHCMKASGPCDWCGNGNLCCNAQVEKNDPNTREQCRAGRGYTHSGDIHECVVAGMATPGPMPTTAMNTSSIGLTSATGAAEDATVDAATSDSTTLALPPTTPPALAPAAPVVGLQTIAPTVAAVITTTVGSESSSSSGSSGDGWSAVFWILFALLILCCCCAACGAAAMLMKRQRDKKTARTAKRSADIESHPEQIVDIAPPEVGRGPESVVELPAEPVVAPVEAVPMVQMIDPAGQPAPYMEPTFGNLPGSMTAVIQPQTIYPLGAGTMPTTQPMMQTMVTQPGMFQFR